MPKSNWKGVISFGLVSIPVALYPARNKSADISFHQIDKRDNSRIKYQRVNATTGKVVPWSEITRGYEYEKDVTIPVPDEILKKVAGDNARAIDIETFINKKDLDVITIENTYYLVPDKKGDKGYVILREALKDTNKIGIAKVIITTKEYLAALMPQGDALILCLLRYAKEMRKLADFDLPRKEIKAYKINKKEIDVAKQLVQSMTTKWKPEKYIDEYQKAVHRWVAESAQHLPHTTMKKRAAAKGTKPHTVNFVDLLKESLASNSKMKSVKGRRVNAKPLLKSKSKYSHATKH